MPFDPSLPAPNSPLESQVIRDQLQALFVLINNIMTVTSAQVDAVHTLPAGSPASVAVSVSGGVLHLSFDLPQGSDGPPGAAGQNGSDGAPGPPGAPFTNFMVDGVSTLNPGDNATVQANYDGSAVRLSFGIPRGYQGDAGPPGTNGMDGSPGPQGPPFTNFVVDNVTQLPPGSWPNVSANFDGNAVRLNFGIPQGTEGPQGSQGPQGPPFAGTVVDGVTTLNPWDAAYVNTSFDGYNVRFTFGIPRGQNGSDGGPGPQGPPGEVTQMQLNSAINGTSNNSNAVGLLGMTVSDPPTVGEVQAIASKLDELINALRR
ncbi:hypothetical protein [Prosthecobacter sp.]|jgi:hypothetical protein|uniref:hypothetical protein n=1 Tax=Prosthecobacter sp. TaxID=1965333 RepID=UPI003784C223